MYRRVSKQTANRLTEWMATIQQIGLCIEWKRQMNWNVCAVFGVRHVWVIGTYRSYTRRCLLNAICRCFRLVSLFASNWNRVRPVIFRYLNNRHMMKHSILTENDDLHGSKRISRLFDESPLWLDAIKKNPIRNNYVRLLPNQFFNLFLCSRAFQLCTLKLAVTNCSAVNLWRLAMAQMQCLLILLILEVKVQSSSAPSIKRLSLSVIRRISCPLPSLSIFDTQTHSNDCPTKTQSIATDAFMSLCKLVRFHCVLPIEKKLHNEIHETNVTIWQNRSAHFWFEKVV